MSLLLDFFVQQLKGSSGVAWGQNYCLAHSAFFTPPRFASTYTHTQTETQMHTHITFIRGKMGYKCLLYYLKIKSKIPF